MNKDFVVSREDVLALEAKFNDRLLALQEKVDRIERSHKRDMADQWTFLSELGIRQL